jgi:hypothetical protein
MTKSFIDHTNTICSICGSKTTYMHGYKPVWFTYKGDKGVWDRRSYQCYRCYHGIGKSKKSRKKEGYFVGRICYLCKSSETYVKDGKYPFWLKYRDENGIWDKKSYLCNKCYGKDWYKKYQRDEIKYQTDCRNIGFDKCSSQGKSIMSEAFIAKILGINIVSIDTDNFCSSVDLEYHPIFGKIQVKARAFMDGEYDGWGGIDFGMEHDFDTLIFACMSKKWKNVERIYTIPESELYGLTGISITKNGQKYEKFRNKDTELYNDAYQDLVSFMNLKNKNIFSIDEIKKWLNRG